MKNKMCIFFVLLTLCGCTQMKKEISVSFKTIDISISDGWTGLYSSKIFDNGQIYLLMEEYKGQSTYYNLFLQAEELDSISRIVNKIIALPVDSIYPANCVDCGYYNLIIQTDKAVFHTFIEDTKNKNTEPMNELVRFIYKLIYEPQYNYSVYEMFQFESKTKDFEFFPLP